jgi:uncharacterized membrane protein
MDSNQPGRPEAALEKQVAELTSRVYRLEETLREHGITPSGAIASASASQNLSETPDVLPPFQIAPPISAAQQKSEFTPPISITAAEDTASSRSDRSLESRIGSQVFNRVGILAVLIGMAWFLKLAIDNHWIGPLGRVLIGLVAGAAFIAWSERFRSKGYAAFSYSLKAVGSGILYLSLWAAFSFFHLIPASVAFVAMILVTAFNGFMSWIQDSELLALYAIVGGFSTPLLLSTGENHEVTLFSYLLLLDIAVLILVTLKPWSRLLASAYLGTTLFYAGWYAEFSSVAPFGLTSFFLAVFFVLFAVAPRTLRLRPGIEEVLDKQDSLALVLLPLVNAALGFLGFYALLENSHRAPFQPWLAVIFAAFYLLLLRWPARGALNTNPNVLSSLHLTVAVVFLTLAIPLKAHGRWITIGWLVEGAALLWLAHRIESKLLRVLALLALTLGLGALVVLNPEASATLLFNQRFATYLVGIAAFACAAWLAAHSRETEDEDNPLSWLHIAAASILAVNLLILLAVGQEIHSYWWNNANVGDWRQMRDYRMYAQFTYSAFFMLFGAALLAIGFWKHSAFLRWQALILLAVSIAKVFLVDVSQLSQGYRILSFLGLGALLLAVSFVYQRDWLGLRGPSTASTPEHRPQ